MIVEFDCTHCGQRLSVDTLIAGQQVKCPACGNLVTAAQQVQPPPKLKVTGNMMFCSKCGQQNQENNFKCTSCGCMLHGPTQPQYVVTDNTMGGLIPFKNARALWAYYLGVFALVPCIGFPLGIAALILGIKGLKFAELHPEARGKGHAWTGIILGTVCMIGYALLTLLVIMIGASHR